MTKTSKKRKYVRLDPSQWAEICALWEIGDVSLAELSDRYSVSPRALQLHFAKHKVLKGAKAAEIAAAVKQELFAEGLADQDLTTARARETRESAYNNAKVVEELIMAQLQAAQKDPSQAIKAASALKALSLAAAGLERLYSLRWSVLGLNKDGVLGDQLPELIIRDLTVQEIASIQEGHGESEDFDEPSTLAAPIRNGAVPAIAESLEDDDIVVEDEAPLDGDREPATTPEGFRLVREARG